MINIEFYTSDKLFDLIKSLTPAEKRYIKVHSLLRAGSGKKNYEKLFDAINKQRSYNEWQLRKKFPKEKFMRQLARIKNYLYEFIVAGLNSYHSSKSSSVIIKKHINSIDILYKKGLIRQCKTSIIRVKKVATSINNYGALLDIIQWERQMLDSHIIKIQKRFSVLDALEKEELIILNKIKMHTFYQNMAYRALWLTNREGITRTNIKSDEIERIIQHPYLQNIKYADTWEMKRMYYEIHSLYHTINGNIQKAHLYRKKIIQLLKGIAWDSDLIVMRIKNATHNFLVTSSYLRQFNSDFDQNLALLKQLSKSKYLSLNEKTAVRRDILKFLLSKNNYLGEYKKSVELIERDFKKTDFAQNKQNALVQFFGIFFATYFNVGDYPKALYYLNKVLNISTLEYRRDVLSIVRVLNIIVHYEMGNVEMAERLLSSTQRYLLKKGKLHDPEYCILTFFKRELPETVAAKIKKNAFRKLKEELLVYLHDPRQSFVFNYFDFITWIDSKIQKRSITEIVKERFERSNAIKM